MNHHVTGMHQVEGRERKIRVANVALKDFNGRAAAAPQKTRVRVERDHLAGRPDTLFQPPHDGTGSRPHLQAMPPARQACGQQAPLGARIKYPLEHLQSH